MLTASVLAKPSRSNIKKHVQFPDEQSCIEEGLELSVAIAEEKPGELLIYYIYILFIVSSWY